MKRVAVFQSNYIPWKGYFDLINMVDEFILYDDMQYTPRAWRNRNRIRTAGGGCWLTIPVRRKSSTQKISETFAMDDQWRRKHWRSICHHYARAPFFGGYRDLLEKLYLGSRERQLSAINYSFLKAFGDILGIVTKLSWSSDFRLDGDRNERLISLCRQAGAGTYHSGPNAKNYLDEAMFAAAEINVEWMDYEGYPPYRQVHSPPFVHEVSVLDLILNMGGKGAREHMLSF